jgi:regulatory protein SWI5
MLSQPTSAIETRRKTHRRQNSTPNIEVSQLRKAPVATGIQRTQSHRGHRRGLSLDQHRSFQPQQRLTPTLGPISQDDISVSINSNNHHTNTGPYLQYRNTPVAQSSLAQPGHLNFLTPGYLPQHGLGLHTPDFSNQSPQYSQFESLSPHASSPGAQSFSNGMPLTPMTPAHQFSSQPSMQQIEDLERHIKAVYGSSEVQINILPTPVSTPQKRASIAIADNLDVSPMPMQFENPDLSMDSALFNREPKFDPNERGYDSSFYSSPSHSTSCSPQQPNVKSFSSANELDQAQFSISDSMMFSSHTTLTDVEHPMLTTCSGDNSPSHSPRPVSLADLSIDGGTIEETGISTEEIQQFISQQDPVTHRWTCLFPGCDAKTFGRRENIRSHVQTHLGDRQYRCASCGKCFVRQHDLKRHAKIHSGNKPYKCPCGGGFARQDALTRHRQRGMCVGAFPDAVRKQSKRGRPRKQRPDMDDRLDKAQRTRERAHSSSSDASAYSGAEDSPSPPSYNDLSSADTAKLVDLPEEEETEDYGYVLF